MWTVGLWNPTTNALCESLEEPLADPKVGNRIVVRGTKTLNKRQENERRRDGRDNANPNLNLISVDSIYEPISALADIGAPVGTFLFVRPVADWGYLFSEIIDELTVGTLEVETDLSDEEEELEGSNTDQDEAESATDSNLEDSDSSDGTAD